MERRMRGGNACREIQLWARLVSTVTLSAGILAAALGCVSDSTTPADSATDGVRTESWTIVELPTQPHNVSPNSPGASGEPIRLNASPTALNGRGQIVGVITFPDPKRRDCCWRAVLWQNGRMVELGTLRGNESRPSAINERGQIVGWSRTADDAPRAALWEDGRTTDLGVGAADDVTENGKIVGSYGDAIVLWERGRRMELPFEGGWVSPPALNEHGDIVGMRRGRDGAEATPASWPWDSPSYAVLSQDGQTAKLATLPGFDLSYASAINDRGQIAGVAMTANGDHHLVLWEAGQMRDLGVIGRGRGVDGEWTLIEVGRVHINERGQVAVATSELFDEGEPGAFVASNGKLQRLPAKIKSISGINDHGQIIGTGNPEGQAGTAFVWRDGRLAELPGHGEVRLAAINERGEIVGTVDGRPMLWKPRRRTP